MSEKTSNIKTHKPNKHLGQHFLHNKGVIQKIITASSLTQHDSVLEIGPGTGVLTYELAKHAKKVIAVEKDKHLAHLLTKSIQEKEISNIEVLIGDILHILENKSLHLNNYKVVANIPYYITSALIRALLEQKQKPENIILTIQKEVAQRICAKNGKESILSLSVKFYADPKLLFFVSKGSFSPQPKVDSAVIEMIPKRSGDNISAELFFKVVKAGFSSPRKKLAANLKKGIKTDQKRLDAAFSLLNLDKNIRAEQLVFTEWLFLTKSL